MVVRVKVRVRDTRAGVMMTARDIREGVTMVRPGGTARARVSVEVAPASRRPIVSLLRVFSFFQFIFNFKVFSML